MRHKLLSLSWLLLALLFGFGINYTLSYFEYYKEIAGIGNAEFVDEVKVTTLSVPVPNEVLVGISNNEKTEAGYLYKVNFYVNFAKRATANMQWAPGEALGTEHLVRFTDIDSEGISSIGVEVTR